MTGQNRYIFLQREQKQTNNKTRQTRNNTTISNREKNMSDANPKETSLVNPDFMINDSTRNDPPSFYDESVRGQVFATMPNEEDEQVISIPTPKEEYVYNQKIKKSTSNRYPLFLFLLILVILVLCFCIIK